MDLPISTSSPQTEDFPEIARCLRCIMPADYPEVQFDSEGVCNFCRAFDNYWQSWMSSPEEQMWSEAQLRTIFEFAKRKKRPYDVLIGLSGGKDSSYMLYLCREKYGLNVLTYTNDSGVLTPEAKSRIEKLVNRFQVPHVRRSEPLFAELARLFHRKTGHFCTVCELSNYNLGMALLREYDIPLCAVGSSSRTEAGAPKFLNPWDPWYFHKVLRGEPVRSRIRSSSFSRKYVILDGFDKLLGHSRILVMPDYLAWDEDKISDLFRKDLGIEFGEEHSDCRFYKVAEYLYRKKYRGYNPRTAKLSLMVRTGKITRDRALEQIHKTELKGPIKGLDAFLEFIGLTPQEFEASSAKMPSPYIGAMSRIFNLARKKIRRQAG
jgi:hypothetical protein